MLDSCDDKNHNYRGKRPTDDECQERKLENVKADVNTELLVNDSKIDSVGKEQPTLPLRRDSCANEEGEQE